MVLVIGTGGAGLRAAIDPDRTELSARDRVALASYRETKEGRGTRASGRRLFAVHGPAAAVGLSGGTGPCGYRRLAHGRRTGEGPRPAARHPQATVRTWNPRCGSILCDPRRRAAGELTSTAWPSSPKTRVSRRADGAHARPGTRGQSPDHAMRAPRRRAETAGVGRWCCAGRPDGADEVRRRLDPSPPRLCAGGDRRWGGAS